LQVPVGIGMDKFGPRRLLTTASLFATFGALVFSLSDGPVMCCVARLMIGFGGSCGFLSCVKLATLWFPSDRLPMVIGVTTVNGKR
jgi:MFS family permease